MTKPVACEEVFHSVSKARVESISMATTLCAMRSSVAAQVASSRSGTATGSCGASAPVTGSDPPPGCSALAAALAASLPIARPPWKPRRTRRRLHIVAKCGSLLSSSANKTSSHVTPSRHEGAQHCRRSQILGQSRQFMVLEADPVHRGLDRAVEQFHHQDQRTSGPPAARVRRPSRPSHSPNGTTGIARLVPAGMRPLRGQRP